MQDTIITAMPTPTNNPNLHYQSTKCKSSNKILLPDLPCLCHPAPSIAVLALQPSRPQPPAPEAYKLNKTRTINAN